MRLYKALFAASIFSLAFFAVSGSSHAADSCEQASELKTCVDMNIATCREDASCTGDREQALTSSDFTDAAVTRCCSRTTKKAARCIRAERRKTTRAIKAAPASLKAFLRQLRSDVRAVDCETNSTTSF